jgi:medium-chain acyl-[acyl-carrier-protein] hydrolase
VKAGPVFTIATPRPKAPYRLFCFPHAGGSPAMFFEWAKHLGPEIECVSVQHPGRGQRLRERPLANVQDMVSEAEEALVGECTRPFAFYGHSLGGIVAFELARRLRAASMPQPIHLFIGSTRPPHLKSPYPPIHMLPREAFLEKVQARYGGIPAAIYDYPEVLEMFLPALRADFTAFETYLFEKQEALDIPVSVFGGDADTVVRPDSLADWALHTTAGFDMNVLSGNHFFTSTSMSMLVRLLHTHITADVQHEKNCLSC